MSEQVHLGKYVLDTAHAIKLGLNSIFGEADLTGLQARVLGFISKSNEEGSDVYQKNIETEFKISRASVTSLLNTLEKNGYVQRSRVKGDARLKKIVLTEKTRLKEERNHTMLNDFEKLLAKDMTEQEVGLLIKLLNKISDNIESIDIEEIRGVKR